MFVSQILEIFQKNCIAPRQSSWIEDVYQRRQPVRQVGQGFDLCGLQEALFW